MENKSDRGVPFYLLFKDFSNIWKKYQRDSATSNSNTLNWSSHKSLLSHHIFVIFYPDFHVLVEIFVAFVDWFVPKGYFGQVMSLFVPNHEYDPELPKAKYHYLLKIDSRFEF